MLASSQQKQRSRAVMASLLLVLGVSSAMLLRTSAVLVETPYVTRAEAAMVLLLTRIPSLPKEHNDGHLTDVLAGAWFESTMILAERYGLLKADPLGRIRPNEPINRAEFLKMMTLTFGLPENLPHRYMDVLPMQWFHRYAGIAYTYKVLPHSLVLPRLAPGNPLTHQEVSRAIQVLMHERGTNFPSLDVLAETRNLAARKLNPHLLISNLEEEVTLVHAASDQKKPPQRRPTPKLAVVRHEDIFDVKRLAEFRADMLRKINTLRAKEGLRPLALNRTLQRSAQQYAEEMAKGNFFSHTSLVGETLKDRIEQSGYYAPFFQSNCFCERHYLLGENLARGQKTVDEVIGSWMESPEHRKAMLHTDFQEIGIGISSGYWAQHFGGMKEEKRT